MKCILCNKTKDVCKCSPGPKYPFMLFVASLFIAVTMSGCGDDRPKFIEGKCYRTTKISAVIYPFKILKTNGDIIKVRAFTYQGGYERQFRVLDIGIEGIDASWFHEVPCYEEFK